MQIDYLAEQLKLTDRYIKMDGAHHFTYLQECKPFGYYLLMAVERGGQVLCKSEENQSRRSYHQDTTSVIVNFLANQGILAQ